MSRVHPSDVECPDCGQRFVGANYPDEDDTHTFKKPTILSRVVKRIFSPFSSSHETPDQTSSVSSTQNGYYQDHPATNQHRHNSNCNGKHKLKRRSDERNRVPDEFKRSEASSPWSSCSPARAWKRSRATATETSFNRSSRVESSSTASRYPLHDLTSARLNLRLFDDSSSIVVDSDRMKNHLNLRSYLQPEQHPAEVIQRWINDHQNDDPVDSLLTQDLSCDCKSGVQAVKDQLINVFLIETSVSLQRLEKSLEDFKSEVPKFIKNGNLKATEFIKQKLEQMVDECSKSHLRTLDILEKTSS